MSKQEVIISSNYNNKVSVLYNFYLNLFCHKSRSHFGGRRAIPIACGGRSTVGLVVAFRLVRSVYASIRAFKRPASIHLATTDAA